MIFIGLGSSIGDAQAIFTSTEQWLADHGIGVIAQSSLLKNPPQGGVAHNQFTNAVWQISTDKSPRQLIELLHQCEADHGRIRNQKWADRTLDIDLLVFGDRVIHDGDLVVPHPEIAYRDFVLKPWQEIAPFGFRIPTLGLLDDLFRNLSLS